MPSQIQLRRGTAQEWSDANPKLALAEMGVETDTNQFKIGNGQDRWNSLAYGGLNGPHGPSGPSGPVSRYVETLLDFDTDLYYPTMTDGVGNVALKNNLHLTYVANTRVLTSPSIRVSSNTPSTSTTTGALIVAGGIGVVGTVNADAIVANRLTGTLQTVSQPNITTLGGVTSIGASSSTTITGTLQTGPQPNITTLGGVTSIGASSSTTIAGTLQTASQPNITSIGTLGSLTVSGAVNLNSLAFDTDVKTSNSLYVAGGAWVDKTLVVKGQTTFKDSVFFNGTATYVYSTNTVYTDNIINMHTPSGGDMNNHIWGGDDGKDIGFVFHYFKGADKNAFLGFDNDSSYLEWYSNGSESTGGAFTGTEYGTFKTGNVIASQVSATSNGQGTNFKVGDDAFIGDINTVDTIVVKGQQNNTNGYIVFGNADTTSKLGRSGSGPLTYAGSFSASGSGDFNSVGVGTSASGTAGEIRATNEITAYYSDRRLKTNVKSIDRALSKVQSLNGITYTPNELAVSFGYDITSKIVGLFADEVEAVLPEAVRPAPFDQDRNGKSISGENYKTIQYEKLVPLLVEAVKELSAEVAELKTIIKSAGLN